MSIERNDPAVRMVMSRDPLYIDLHLLMCTLISKYQRASNDADRESARMYIGIHVVYMRRELDQMYDRYIRNLRASTQAR